VGICYADHATPVSAKVGTTSPRSGCRSVGRVRSRTKATEFSLVLVFLACLIVRPWRCRRHFLRNVGWLSTDYTRYIPEDSTLVLFSSRIRPSDLRNARQMNSGNGVWTELTVVCGVRTAHLHLQAVFHRPESRSMMECRPSLNSGRDTISSPGCSDWHIDPKRGRGRVLRERQIHLLC
jgi:hypothetical protein